MADLNEYLGEKRQAVHNRRRRVQSGEAGLARLAASARAEGRSGVRRIRIRDFQVISDSPPDFAGYNLGPSSPELLIGALSSCLTHTWLIHAADRGLPLESVEAHVEASIDPRGGSEGFDDVPVYPHDIAYEVTIVSPAGNDEVAAVAAAVEKFCPILNLLKRATEINGRITHRRPDAPALSTA